MNNIVDPEGPKLAILPTNPAPEGLRAGYFTTPDKVRLRYATFPKTAGAAKGTVCLVQGRTEFIEKYFETVADFQKRGFAVATFDWRGQGGSDRLIRNRKLGFVRDFNDYWVDLQSFHANVLLPDCPGPYYLVGHSMGGLVSLIAATRDRMMFDRVFVGSPMVGLAGQPLSFGGMAAIADAVSFFGFGRMPVGREADELPSEKGFPGNALTSDLPRYMRTVDIWNERPDLIVGKPTFKWAAAAMHAMANAGTDSFPASIKVPVMMLAAARDEVVSTGFTEQLGLRMRTGHHVVIPAARHEMFMENDSIRAQVFAAFDAFITEQSS
ncbi:MAG: alpha/beta hydrolase [Devosia sp.]